MAPSVSYQKTRVTADVTFRIEPQSDGQWMWEALVNGARHTHMALVPEMGAVEVSSHGYARSPRAALRRGRRCAAKLNARVNAPRLVP